MMATSLKSTFTGGGGQVGGGFEKSNFRAVHPAYCIPDPEKLVEVCTNLVLQVTRKLDFFSSMPS